MRNKRYLIVTITIVILLAMVVTGYFVYKNQIKLKESSLQWNKEIKEKEDAKKQEETSYVIEEDMETIWSPNGYNDTGKEVPFSAFVNGCGLGCTFDYAGHSYIITKIFYPSENARDMTGRTNWQVYDLTENHYYYFLNTLSGQLSREGLTDELVLFLYDAY